MFKQFKQFILKGNVVDLAVGVVIGASFGTVVTALVKGIVTPLIGAFGGAPDFSSLVFTVNGSKFLIGEFINALLSFLINASVIYFFVVVPMNKLISMSKKEKPADPTTRDCPECTSEIPLAAKRCMHCTAIVSPKK